jgi:GNAT superfamily N-acetyltransferase
MKNNLKFSVVKQSSREHPIYETIRSKLKADNENKIGHYEINNYIFAYHNENNDLVAGLCAFYRLGVFHIELLWVDESLREQKLGTKLLEQAEAYARKNGALYIKVNTATFQALDFYLKNGYEVFAKLPLLITGMKNQFDYFLIKYL